MQSKNVAVVKKNVILCILEKSGEKVYSSIAMFVNLCEHILFFVAIG